MDKPRFQDFALQGEEIRALRSQISSGRLNHALLITGSRGIGKRTLARLMTAALFCSDEGERPCGRCSGCHRAFDGEHPDLISIEKGIPLSGDTKKSKASIPIDDIREMIRLSSAYPIEGGNRVVQIFHAEDMTPQAQNALLKILEEPPANTYFILTSAHPEQLLVTIKSRCAAVRMKPWDESYILQVLTEDGVSREIASQAAAAAHGSIGVAKQLAADEDFWKTRDEIISCYFHASDRSSVIALSSGWKENKKDAGVLFDTLEDAVRILLEFRMQGREDSRLKAFSEGWISFAASADYSRFLHLFDRIREARMQQASNVNIQVIIEQLFLGFMGEIHT